MIAADKLITYKKIFFDTAPIIYFIEANPEYGKTVKNIYEAAVLHGIAIMTSVITISEVIAKPAELKKMNLVRIFIEFLANNPAIHLCDVNKEISERAGLLCGRYKFLRTIDAIQLSCAIESGAEVFFTNDHELKKIKEIKVVILKD